VVEIRKVDDLEIPASSRTPRVDLLIRTTRGVDLTPAGEALVAHAAELLTEVQTELDALVAAVVAAGCPAIPLTAPPTA
jgi:DNA-binding transcriptional LysR family regulator